jgi:hypothetical protein
VTRYAMKLSKQEFGLIIALRESVRCQLPDWAMTIEFRDGAWDVFIRGMIGGKRGVGPTFEAAWDAFCTTELEDLSFPPS